jgi:hypothetical protein
MRKQHLLTFNQKIKRQSYLVERHGVTGILLKQKVTGWVLASEIKKWPFLGQTACYLTSYN